MYQINKCDISEDVMKCGCIYTTCNFNEQIEGNNNKYILTLYDIYDNDIEWKNDDIPYQYVKFINRIYLKKYLKFRKNCADIIDMMMENIKSNLNSINKMNCIEMTDVCNSQFKKRLICFLFFNTF